MLATLSFRAAELWPICLLLLILLGLAVVLLYAHQVRTLSRPWHWVLPTLRGVALAAVAVSILRPVITRDKTAQEEGAIVVLLDRSLSMGAQDRLLSSKPEDSKRLLSQLMGLADDLRLLPENVRSRSINEVGQTLKRLESLSEDIARARREVDYARLSGRGPQAAQSRLDQAISTFLAAAKDAQDAAHAMNATPAVIDHLAQLARPPAPEQRDPWIHNLSALVQQARAPAEASQDDIDQNLYRANQQVHGVCDWLAGLSRLNLCWLSITGGNRSFLSQLDNKTPIVGFSVADALMPLPLQRESPIQHETPVASSAPVEPLGIASDLTGGLRQALQRLAGLPVQAVILFSDGRQVGARGTFPAGLLPSGVPIFTVAVASPHMRDLTIEHVELPRSVFVGETLTAHLIARSINLEPSRIIGQARLAPDGAEPVSATLRMRDQQPDDEVKSWRLEAELKVRLDKPGLQRIVFSLPVQDGEASSANNQVERWVKVTSQTLNVLAISGSPNWDFRYLRNAMLRAPFVRLRDAIVVPGLSALAMTRHDILQQDLIILNDVSRDSLSIDQWDAIRELVTQRGGSVILIPGIAHLQQDYTGHVLSDLLPHPALATPAWRIWPGESPHYHAVPVRSAENLDVFRLDDDPDLSRRRWEQLPGFYRYLALPDLKPNAKVLLTERQSREPLLTESRLGTGRVFFLAMNETWRWRYKVGSRDYDRFWLQLLRYAADEPYALANGPMLLDVDTVVASPGTPIHVRSRLNSRQSDLPMPTAIDLSIMQRGQLLRTVSLEPAGNASDGRYAATLSQLQPGDYELQVTSPSGDYSSADLSLPIRIAPNLEPECNDLTGDREFLQRLAEATGGKCLSLEQIGTLPGLLEESRLRQPRSSELHLWDSYYLFVFVVSCLAAEWALRKRLGLV